MTLLRRLFRGPRGQRVGHATGRAGRHALGRLFETVLPKSRLVPLQEVRDVSSVLIVRPNFRIGNTLMTNAIIPALRERFPGARLEYLAGDTTTALLDQLPLDGIHPMSRSYVRKPWEFVALFARLRRERFDVAVEAGMGSFSGGLYSFLTGARYRIGVEGRGERFLNVLVPRPVCQHAYDDALLFGDELGMQCVDRPVYRLAPGEVRDALSILEPLGLVADEQARPFVAVFVGGHLDKRWSDAAWIAFIRGLGSSGVRFVIFLGPEEVELEGPLREALGPTGDILLPQPLRRFAALLASAQLLVTPDSGPMHLGVALGVPTVALLQSVDSCFYEPRGAADRSAISPDPDEALELVLTHPSVRRAETAPPSADGVSV